MVKSEWAIVPLRVAIGLVFLMHGAQKLFVFGLQGTGGFLGQLGVPLPALAATVVIAVELLGGLAILVGVVTRPAAILLAAQMLVAIFAVHLREGFFLPNGFEFSLTLFAAALTLAGIGPGALSVEAALGRRSR